MTCVTSLFCQFKVPFNNEYSQHVEAVPPIYEDLGK